MLIGRLDSEEAQTTIGKTIKLNSVPFTIVRRGQSSFHALGARQVAGFVGPSIAGSRSAAGVGRWGGQKRLKPLVVAHDRWASLHREFRPHKRKPRQASSFAIRSFMDSLLKTTDDPQVSLLRRKRGLSHAQLGGGAAVPSYSGLSRSCS